MTHKRVSFHTLGCKLNFSESSTLARQFERGGYTLVEPSEACDVAVINSCSVTEHADKKCRNIIRKIHRRNPNAIIAVTGCYAQLKPNDIAEIDGVRVGMMIAVDGEHYRKQRDKMYPQLKGLFDVSFGKGWDEMEDEAKAGEFYIDSLAVSLPYRNQGVGTALVEKAKEMAKEIGIERVTLAVEPMNTAKKLYQRLGFVFEREITIFNEVYHLYARK